MIKHRLQLKRIQKYSRKALKKKTITVNDSGILFPIELFGMRSYLPMTRDAVMKLLDIFKTINKINIDIKDYNTRLDYIETVMKETSKKGFNPYDSKVVEELTKMIEKMDNKDLHSN